jgi:nucleotidyltransferase/DNA polymerase involved in DNA repair
MPAQRHILHVDMDAFYASVEQLDHPEHQSKPVVVGADPREGKGRGVVAACSYEARAFGIHSALPIGKAWRMCPQAVFLRPRFRRYAEISAQVFTILRRYTDLVEPLSIDEAFLDVTGSVRLFGSAETIGREIKGAIRSELGLVASVGVAPNKFVAKVASDLGKPDGFVVVKPGEAGRFLAPLPISRLWGVGPKTAAQLGRFGLRTIGDIARWPREELKTALGASLDELWLLAQGRDERPVVAGGAPKSIGAEVTFREDTDDPGRVQRALLSLADRVGTRLRRKELVARGLTLKFRDERFVTTTRSLMLPRPTDLGDDIHRAALELLDRIPWRGRKVRLVGVAANHLSSAGSAPGLQLDLFEAKTDGRRRRLADTVDDIRGRFGDHAIDRAVLIEGTSEDE